MPTSLSDIKVKNSTSTLVIKPDDITINGVSIVGQNSFADKDLSNLSTTGQAVLDNKANDSDVVHKTGNETIGGTKTFTSHIYQQAESPRMVVRDMTLTRGQAGDGGVAKFQVTDKNNKTLGELRVYNESDGSSSTVIAAATEDTSGNQLSKSGFRVTARPNGTGEVSLTGVDSVYAPHPSASDNSNKIATTNWVTDPAKSTNVVHRSGDETINGIKTFTGQINSSYGVDYGSNKQIMGIQGFTSDGKLASLLQGWAEPTKNVTGIYCFNPSGQYEGIAVTINANGDVITHAPTPVTTANSTQIATTAFVNNKLQVVSTLPASPTSGVFYFVKE